MLKRNLIILIFLATTIVIYFQACGTSSSSPAPSPGAVALPPAAIPPPTLYAYNFANNHLVSFRADTPGTFLTDVALTGLTAGDFLLGLDFRPSTGELFTVVSNAGQTLFRVSTVNVTTGAVLSFPTFAATSGLVFGFDFNPLVDRIRLVSDTDVNMRLNPSNGAIAATDTSLAYSPGDSGAGFNPAVEHVAYSNSYVGAPNTTLYAIDTARGVLVTIGSVGGGTSPNSGQLFTVGSLGFTASVLGGFDIQPLTNTGYAVLRIGGLSNLYSINTTSGAATFIGTIGSTPNSIDGLAVAP